MIRLSYLFVFAAFLASAVQGAPTLTGTYGCANGTMSGSYTSATIDEVAPMGTDRLLVVSLASWEWSEPPAASSVTFGGVALTKLTGGYWADTGSFEIWYLVNPSTSSASVNVTLSRAAIEYAVIASTYSGVDQTTPFGIPSTAYQGTENTASVSPASSADDLLLFFAAADDVGAATTGSQGLTMVREEYAAGFCRHALFTASGGTASGTLTGGGETKWKTSAAGVAIRPAIPSMSPTIKIQPASATVATGQSAGFSVLAEGAPPLTYQWRKSGVPIGGATGETYMIASATANDAASYAVTVSNSFGSVTSETVVLSVTSNQAPAVELTVPETGASFSLPASITLVATASDADGTIAKVEFFSDAAKIGEKTTSPYTLSWTPTNPGQTTLTAVATDALGASTTSAAVSVALLPTPPYMADFETAEGYTLGTLNGQLGWSVSAGVAQIVSGVAAHGSQYVTFNPGTTATVVNQELGPSASNPAVIFVDFQAKPVAGADTSTGTLFDLDAARVACVLSGTTGQLLALDGDGAGAGTWKPCAPAIALDADNVATAWQRLTVRLDYAALTYDLYLNGAMIAAGLKFRVAVTPYVSWFSVKGHTAASATLDTLYVGSANPLFADVNNNGIDDAWETAHGLPLSSDNRGGDPDGDGSVNLQEYLVGTDPKDFYNGASPVLSIVSGNNQSAAPGLFNAQAVVVLVQNAGGLPLANAPVMFTVSSGDGLLGAEPAETSLLSTILCRTSVDGTARAYFKQPMHEGLSSQIRATAGGSSVLFDTLSSGGSALPVFVIDFESGEGYGVGPVDGQNSWAANSGSTVLPELTAPSGTRCLAISPVGGAYRSLGGYLTSNVQFVQFNIRPSVNADNFITSYLRISQVGVGFGYENGQGRLFIGRESDGFQYSPSNFYFELDPAGRSQNWFKVTIRADRVSQRYDVLIDDVLVASDFYSYTPDMIAFLEVGGGGIASTLLDRIAFYEHNPIFMDQDGDGMSDEYETAFGLNPNVDDRDADPDSDGLSNFLESLAGLNPFSNDTDGDGLSDKWELENGYNPLVAESADALSRDEDNDGLTTLQEASSGTNPVLADTDGDGIPDGAEVQLGLDPLYSGDAGLDNDGDGVNNLQEYLDGTNPNEYYNGSLPVVTPLIGSQGELGENNSFKVLVKNADGVILRNAPVRFQITEGKTRLATDSYSSESSIDIEVRSDDDGIATVYVLGERPE